MTKAFWIAINKAFLVGMRSRFGQRRGGIVRIP